MPVPRNRLVVLVLVGAFLSTFVSVGLAYPTVVNDVPGLEGNETAPKTGSPDGVQSSPEEEPTPHQRLSVEREGEIHIAVQDSLQPGQSVTLKALAGGEPVPGALVEVNGDTVGRTNADGEIEVSVPHGEFRAEIETSDVEGELRIER